MKIDVYIRVLILLFVIFFTVFILSCPSDSSITYSPEPSNLPLSSSRSFYMGFTPWPYAATVEAVNHVYDFINTEGDIVAHHFQQGIPYTAPDTLDFSTYAQNIQDEINGRISNTEKGKAIYLAIDCLNMNRDDLEDLWDTSPDMPRPAPWDARSFDSVEVQTAFVNYSIVVIEKFNEDYGALPVYFNYAPEISDLMINDVINNTDKYTDFITFAQTVYNALKNTYPDSIKLMVSLALKSPNSAEMETVQTGFESITDYVDVVGISTYAYAFYSHSDKGNPDNLHADWITQIVDIAPGKAYAVAETGWIAEDLSIPAYGLDVSSNETYQDAYLKKLLFECQYHINAEFIVWFTPFDYDTLWEQTLGSDDLSKIWKDIGLIDESFHERDALTTWRQWASKQR